MNATNSKRMNKTYGPTNKKYRTVLCTRYAAGYCDKGEDCWFKHDPSLVPNAPPSTVDPYAVPLCPPPPSSNSICVDFIQRGMCANGDKCVFLHNVFTSQLQGSPTMSTVSFTTGPSTPSSTTASIRSRKQPCFDFMRSGVCRYGEDCQYHHEVQKTFAWYRVTPCKDFLTGNCTRGDNCIFLHASRTPSPSPLPPMGLVDPQPLYQTKQCQYCLSGQCSGGDQCSFLQKQIYGKRPSLLTSEGISTRSPPPARSQFYTAPFSVSSSTGNGMDSNSTVSLPVPRAWMIYSDTYSSEPLSYSLRSGLNAPLASDDDVVYQPPSPCQPPIGTKTRAV